MSWAQDATINRHCSPSLKSEPRWIIDWLAGSLLGQSSDIPWRLCLDRTARYFIFSESIDVQTLAVLSELQTTTNAQWIIRSIDCQMQSRHTRFFLWSGRPVSICSAIHAYLACLVSQLKFPCRIHYRFDKSWSFNLVNRRFNYSRWISHGQITFIFPVLFCISFRRFRKVGSAPTAPLRMKWNWILFAMLFKLSPSSLVALQCLLQVEAVFI